MASPKVLLFVALGLVGAFFAAAWIRARHARPAGASTKGLPDAWELGVGVVTNFFDTLGIGSFAPTTSAWKLRSTMPDELIPARSTSDTRRPS